MNSFYSWLMQLENWNFKNMYAINQAGVHLFLCFSMTSIVTSLLCVSRWFAFGYILVIAYPLVKEFLIDGHRPWREEPARIIDFWTDMLTNYLGIVLALPFAVLNWWL